MRKRNYFTFCWLLVSLVSLTLNPNSIIFAQHTAFAPEKSKLNFRATQPYNLKHIKKGSWNPENIQSQNGWTFLGNVPGALPTELSIAPSNPQIVYAGTWGDGIYRTQDGGNSWSLTGLNDRLISGPDNSVVVAPDDANRVYVTVLDAGDYMGGLYRTDNGGITWQQLEAGLPKKSTIETIAIAPTQPNHVYVSISDTLYFSQDWGNNWQLIHTGIPFRYLVISSNDENTIIGSHYDVVSISTDGGFNWTERGTPNNYINHLQVDPTNINVIYAASYSGMYKSEDGGVMWDEIELPFETTPFIQDLKVEQVQNGFIYVATDSGIVQSGDKGTNWTFFNNGLGHMDVSSICVDPTPGGNILAGTWWGGVYKSKDRISWQPSNFGFTHTFINQIISDPVFSNTLYAAFLGSGIYKSIDGGILWNDASEGLTDPYVNTIAMDPTNRFVIYSGTYFSGVFKSVDGGLNWNPANNGIPEGENIEAISIDRINSQIIYAGGNNSIYRSENGGASWIEINVGLPSYLRLKAVVQDIQNSQILYLATGAGVFKSIDVGMNWINISESYIFDDIQSLIIDSENANILYAGTWGDGIYKSTDQGFSWQRLEQAYSLFRYAGTLTQSKVNPNTFFAGSWGAGVFRSTNGGNFWENISEKMKNKGILFLGTFPGNDETLLAATYRGIFSFSYPATSAKPLFEETKNNKYSLYQNYPNPFNPETMIKYVITSPSIISLKIYNVNGSLIRTLLDNKPHKTGKYSVRWDARDQESKIVASGIYFYTLQTDKFKLTKRMILIR